MRRLATTTLGLALLATAATAAWHHAPALRAQLSRQLDRWTAWDEDARNSDPEGFIDHVKTRLKRDLAALTDTRDELAAETSRLARESRGRRALLEQAEALAEDFRRAYRTHDFPVVVRGAAYTRAQVERQVRSLLAEIDGYRTALAQFERVRTQAERKREELTLCIDKTEAELALLPARRQLARSRQLADGGRALVAQVEALATGNRRAIAGSPVRSVRELLAADADAAGQTPDADRIRRFLNADAAANASSPSDTDEVPAPIETTAAPPTPPVEPPVESERPPSPTPADAVAAPPTPNRKPAAAKPRPGKRGKPIFEQS